jgi:hypothetical protein
MSSAPVSRRSLVEAIVASTVGTTIEWYDFFLYGAGLRVAAGGDVAA